MLMSGCSVHVLMHDDDESESAERRAESGG